MLLEYPRGVGHNPLYLMSQHEAKCHGLSVSCVLYTTTVNLSLRCITNYNFARGWGREGLGRHTCQPPPHYFFTILTLPLNIRTLGSPVTTTPQISSTGHLTPGQFPRQPPFSGHFPPKQFPSSDISSPCALRAEKFPSPPEHYTMAKYSGVTIITRIDKLLGPLSELSGAPKYFNRKSFTYFFVYILYPYLFVPRRFVSKASLPLTQS